MKKKEMRFGQNGVKWVLKWCDNDTVLTPC